LPIAGEILCGQGARREERRGGEQIEHSFHWGDSGMIRKLSLDA
jgi:hypothetical protein